MTNASKLIKDLIEVADNSNSSFYANWELEVINEANKIIKDPSKLSDGYHTFEELYEHRHALCLALMKSMPEQWWFSLRHADGEFCFDGDWFIVGAELPESITYHLPMRLLEAARATGATELPVGRPWDGHTPKDVVSRLVSWASNTVKLRTIKNSYKKGTVSRSEVKAAVKSIKERNISYEELLKAYKDAITALKYIECHNGRLYGVGWERVYETSEKLIYKD